MCEKFITIQLKCTCIRSKDKDNLSLIIQRRENIPKLYISCSECSEILFSKSAVQCFRDSYSDQQAGPRSAIGRAPDS